MLRGQEPAELYLLIQLYGKHKTMSEKCFFVVVFFFTFNLMVLFTQILFYLCKLKRV